MLMIYNLDGRFTLDSQNNIMKKVIDIWTEKIRASDEYDEYDDYVFEYLASII